MGGESDTFSFLIDDTVLIAIWINPGGLEEAGALSGVVNSESWKTSKENSLFLSLTS